MSTARRERFVFFLPAAAAMATVALGLRLGAGRGVQAAVVQGALRAGAGTGLAWSIAVYREDGSVRESVAGIALDVTARQGDASVNWRGTTNDDGIAEALLPLPTPAEAHDAPAPAAPVTLDVRAAGAVLAAGTTGAPPIVSRARASAGWMPFARRDGAIALDVATLGQRVAPGFPAVLWVRATDATTGAPWPGIALAVDGDSSLAAIDDAGRRSDSGGWAELGVTPVGLAVALALTASAADGRSGRWVGGLFMSPGAPRLDVPSRVRPGDAPVLTLTMLEAPASPRDVYVEIDDARGRAWAATLPLAASQTADLQATALAPGLYWAVAASSAAGAAELGPGTTARPFFVAATDEAALAFGTDRTACAPPRDLREMPRAVGACLAMAGALPVTRWVALDGFEGQYDARRATRTRGLVVAVGALVVAALLETALLLRAAALARAGFRVAIASAEDAANEDDDENDAAAGTRSVARHAGAPTWGVFWTVAVAVLVGLLGFALLAAFLLRVG